MQPSVILSDFTPMRVSQAIPQEKLLKETANLFALVQSAIQRPQSQAAADRILAEAREMIQHYGVSSNQIKQREFNSMVNVDVTNGNNAVYPDVIPQPLQQPGSERSAGETLHRFCDEAPDDLIHVTATGYMSPSPVQQLVARKNWNDTIITHSYQMGCYGAFPGVRIAHGLMSTSFVLGRPKSRIDIFHTEYASLHLLDFYRLIPHKIVSMTLFGDGFIHYSVFSQDSFDAGRQNGLKILAIHERIIPDSEEEMTLGLEQNQFVMYLSPAVPAFIGEYIEAFVEDVVAMASYRLGEIKDDLIFAIHPGGPKILEHIRERLHLTRQQMHYSWEVLYKKGNMASATVPYVWHAIVNDDTIPKGKLVLSMAFGPGLTACGMLMEKV
uniref:Predicted naringenin-chalcone synthase n=1 Tax=Candidatus Kentrum sp. TUN TaxID=2126343 RepID=A0A450ZZC2_9GAMM|nr:MAG: Predicted naringenin-chalcone synthase [Candidatus Kentron sp. TUN]VFK67725.1 MAG: Predicted naringenin-chalcone synthase [Candidatus Kentron sp. TUN]